MRKFLIRYPCPIEPERFWREVFFDREFRERLREAYQFVAYDVVEETVLPDGRRTLRARVTPRLEMPPDLRRRYGDSGAFIESSRLEIEGPHAPRWVQRFHWPKRCVENFVSIEKRLERTGPQQSDWVAEVMLASGCPELLEFFEQVMRDCYQRGAEFTDRWLREHHDVSMRRASRLPGHSTGALARPEADCGLFVTSDEPFAGASGLDGARRRLR